MKGLSVETLELPVEGTASVGTPESVELAPSLPSTVIGTIIAVHGKREAQVEFPGNPNGAAVCARSTVDLVPAHVGSSVALVFENAAPGRPIVIGVLYSADDARQGLDQPSSGTEIHIDGERL